MKSFMIVSRRSGRETYFFYNVAISPAGKITQAIHTLKSRYQDLRGCNKQLLKAATKHIPSGKKSLYAIDITDPAAPWLHVSIRTNAKKNHKPTFLSGKPISLASNPPEQAAAATTSAAPAAPASEQQKNQKQLESVTSAAHY